MSGRASTSRVHRYTDDMLHDLWRKDGRIYRTLGIITDPAVIIEDVVSGDRETHVIHSRNFAEYERLRPEARDA